MLRTTLVRAVVTSLAFVGLAGCMSSGGSGGGGGNPVPAGPAVTNTTLTTPSISLPPAASIPLTATVTSASGVVSGTVAFYDGTALIQRGIALVNGVATSTYPIPTLGVHSFTASYEGSANFLTSTSAVLSVSVMTPTTTALSVDSFSIPSGGTLKLTSTTTPAGSGTVTFYDGANALGTFSLALLQTQQSLSVSTLSVGSHSLTARYSGDTSYSPSTSTPVVVNVGTASASNIVLTEASTSGYIGSSVALTVTLSPTATGTVSFFDGTLPFGSAPLVNGVASTTFSPPYSGANTLTAVYHGDANNLSGSSNPVSYTVLLPPGIHLTSSSASLPLGTPLTLTATLSPSSSTGTVTFYDGYKNTYDLNYQRYVITLGPAIGSAVVTDGVATFDISGLSSGTHTLAAAIVAGERSVSNALSFEVTPSTASCGLTAAMYELTSGTATIADQALTATSPDQSPVCAANTGTSLTLSNPTLIVTGGSSSLENSRSFGLDSAVLAYGSSASSLSGAGISIPSGGSITTSASGANGIFATGKGASVTASGMTISTSGEFSHAADVSQAGAVTLNQSTLTTSGPNSAPLATELSGGTLAMTAGSATATGSSSPAIRAAAGTVSVTNATASSAQDNGAVLSGSVTLNLSGTALSGALHGVLISNPGATWTTLSTVKAANGSITATSGDVFHVTGGATVFISLTGGTSVSTGTGMLFNVQGGAMTTINATGQQLTGDTACDSASYVNLSLTSGSSLRGSINHGGTAWQMNVTLDSTSKWELTGTSYVGSLQGATIALNSVWNIIGNGYTLYYLSSANPSLNGKTYALGGGAGGLLKPF